MCILSDSSHGNHGIDSLEQSSMRFAVLTHIKLHCNISKYAVQSVVRNVAIHHMQHLKTNMTKCE
jgi:hypothetical protein